MARQTPSQPKYRHYKPKDLAVVRLDGRDYYLGKYNSPESWEKYHRLIAQWLRGDAKPLEGPPAPVGQPAASLTINQLLNAYRDFARTYYVKDGEPTKELTEMKHAARPLRQLYGSTAASEFGPLALKAVRNHMIGVQKLSRGVINNRINRIKRIFKWGVSEELVPAAVYQGLRAVDGLRFGRTEARETEPVRPVPWEWVEPILACASSQVSTMIQVQWLTGMRPCELVKMRACDIDTTGEIWIYEPHDHKNRWRGYSRLIPLGPRVQRLIKPYFKLSTQAYLFSPKEAEAERNRKRRAERRSPMTPSQQKRKPRPRPKRAKRDCYDVDSYRRDITYAIRKANKTRDDDNKIPDWFPLQLRHSRATEVRKTFGLEAAQVALGHKRADVTQLYAERNLEQAVRIARDTG